MLFGDWFARVYSRGNPIQILRAEHARVGNVQRAGESEAGRAARIAVRIVDGAVAQAIGGPRLVAEMLAERPDRGAAKPKPRERPH